MAALQSLHFVASSSQPMYSNSRRKQGARLTCFRLIGALIHPCSGEGEGGRYAEDARQTLGRTCKPAVTPAVSSKCPWEATAVDDSGEGSRRHRNPPHPPTRACGVCKASYGHNERGNTMMDDLKQGVMGLSATLLLSTGVMSSSLMGADSASALDTAIVQGLFQRSCVGCHVGGGNIIQQGAGLTASDLQRNGVPAVDDIYKIVYSGKGRMPGYGEKCAPRGQCTFGPRLSDEDIRSLAEFVRMQADHGWISLR